MYIVDLTYLKSLAEIEPHLVAHRAFLDEHYARGIFIASGPKNPRDG
ncbi:MAG: GTP cyclohydrolase, partial [Pseudomonadota bacterium]